MANWTPAIVPGPTNDVVISNGATVTLNSAGVVVYSLALSAGTLSIGNGDSLSMSKSGAQTGGILTGAGTLTVPNGSTFTWSQGTMAGTGTIATAVGGTLVLSPTACCSAANLVLDQRALSNAGTVTWSACCYGFTVQNGASITNQAGAVFDIQGDQPLVSTGAAPVFSNAGTLQKTGSGGTTSLRVALINTGTVSVSSGTLGFGGSFSQAAAGTLSIQLSGASCTLAPGVQVTGGTANLGGALSIATSGGCAPASAQLFQILTFPARSGDFSSITSPYALWYTSTTMTVAQVPDDVTLAAPQRLVDTRTQGPPIGAGLSRCFTLAGQGGIPNSAAGVILNVTAVGYSDFGWLTLYPGGQASAGTSTLNFDTSEYAIANGAIVKLGNGGAVCVTAGRSASHVVLDAIGYLPRTAGELQLLSQPHRVVDTRSSGGPISDGASRCFSIAGQVGIPANAEGVLVNVTAVGYSDYGWLSLFPEGQGVPPTSTVNFDPSEYAVANSAMMGLGTSGKLCVSDGRSSSDVVIDATGYVSSGGVGPITLLSSPQRVMDTRTSGGPVAAGQAQCLTLAGQAGIPSTATGVILNVTAVGYTDFGWLTLYPYGQSLASTSTLNFDTHEYAIANGAVVQTGADGRVCVNAGRSASHVLLDVVGYLAP